MTGLRATISGADFSADNVGVIGPYTSVNLDGLFDLRVSHERARHNHASPGASPCLLNRASPPTFQAGHMATNAVRQLIFPAGPLHNADNTMFGIFEAHRAGGAAPQAPLGLSISGSPNLRGQFLLANGPNYLRTYTYTRTDPNNFLAAGTQRYASYQLPTNGSLDNQMIFAVGVIRNGAGVDLYIPGINAAAPVGTVAIPAGEGVFFGSDAASNNIYDLWYRASAYAGSAEKTRCFGYAHRALSLSEINQVYADLKSYYAAHALSFV